jgi:lipopolysaccharide transport system ATP-binding protein
MSDVAIRVDGLGKRYRLGGSKARYHTLRDTMTTWAKRPLGALRELRNRSKAETFWALKDVSFEIRRGEVVGVIGRNGAGKSTLLKILSRITEPTQGGADIFGRVGSLLEVGTGFNPELTGRENVFLNGAILGMRRSEIARKFADIVEFAEVEKFVDTPVKHYSSGMYMRLAFAVAAHLEPEILVVDEVLAVGDSQFQKKCLGKMNEAAHGGRTVLFVSHDMRAIETLCQRCVHFQLGRLKEYGATKDVIRTYLQETADSLRSGVDGSDLGPDLRLESIKFNPCVLPSLTDTSVVLTLMGKEDTVLHELAVLLYTMKETRAAIIDLRADSGPIRLQAGQSVCFETQLRGLALVEGQYQVGLFINSNSTLGDFTNLGLLEVTAREPHSRVIPYPPKLRGLVETDVPNIKVTIN